MERRPEPVSGYASVSEVCESASLCGSYTIASSLSDSIVNGPRYQKLALTLGIRWMGPEVVSSGELGNGKLSLTELT